MESSKNSCGRTSEWLQVIKYVANITLRILDAQHALARWLTPPPADRALMRAVMAMNQHLEYNLKSFSVRFVYSINKHWSLLLICNLSRQFEFFAGQRSRFLHVSEYTNKCDDSRILRRRLCINIPFMVSVVYFYGRFTRNSFRSGRCLMNIPTCIPLSSYSRVTLVTASLIISKNIFMQFNSLILF